MRSRFSHGELSGRGRKSNAEERVVGSEDAGIGSGGIVGVDFRFGESLSCYRSC
jgi:hypothetical protein